MKKKNVRFLICMLAVTAVVLVLPRALGYRGMPIASNGDQFINYLNKMIKHGLLSHMWEIESEDGTIVLHFTENAVLESNMKLGDGIYDEDFIKGLSHNTYVRMITNNAASLDITIDDNDTFAYHKGLNDNQLKEYGWNRDERLSNYYVNSQNQGFFVGTASIGLTIETESVAYDFLGEKAFDIDAPDFSICGGINNNSSLGDILLIVGDTPEVIKFYPNGCNEISVHIVSDGRLVNKRLYSKPVVAVQYPVIEDGKHEGWVCFFVDAERNKILRIIINNTLLPIIW